jgi:hypothetical protein
MPRVISDPKCQADDGGDPRAGPELSAEAIGHGPAMQQLGQPGELVGRQPPRGPGWRSTPERLGTGGAGPCHPLTDGSLADPQGLGNLALAPALLLEMPGLEPSGFFPVVWWRVHTWKSTTKALRL